MTIDEMIKDFEDQRGKIRGEISEIEEALKARQEQLLRLGGAIEGLRLAEKNLDDAPVATGNVEVVSD